MVLCKYQHIGTPLLPPSFFLIFAQDSCLHFLPIVHLCPQHIGTHNLEYTNLLGLISTFKSILSAQRMIDEDFPERLNISYCRSVHVCISSINYIIPIVFVFILVKQKSWGDGPSQGHPSQVIWVATCLCTHLQGQLPGWESSLSLETVVFVFSL